MLQADPATVVGHHLVEHARANVRRDHDAVRVPLQSAGRKVRPPRRRPNRLPPADIRIIASTNGRGVKRLPNSPASFLASPIAANTGARPAIRSRELGDDVPLRARLPAGATTASVACRNGVAWNVWNVTAKSSRSYIVVTGST